MNRRSGRILRNRSALTGHKRKARKVTEEDLEAKREYERNKKRKQREKQKEEGPKKRGPKVKVDLKNMSQEEKREYDEKTEERIQNGQETKGSGRS